MKKDKKPSVPLDDIYQAIKQRPGITRTGIAKKTGAPRNSLEGRLASLEHRDYKIFEDEYGRLYIDD